MPPFHFPFFYSQNNYYRKPNLNNTYNKSISQNSIFDSINSYKNKEKPNSSKKNVAENYFFELFGLKLYFDDILLICLLFFLYEEGVKDDELFVSIVLLLIS